MREPISPDLRAAVLLRDRNRCVVCGSTEDLAIDHVHPVAEGGVSRIENLQTLCKPCNTSKKDRDGQEWLSSGMWRRRWQPKNRRCAKQHTSGHPLIAWMAENDVRAFEMAARLGISGAHMSRLISGKTEADCTILSAIRHQTNGGVTPNDWCAWWDALPVKGRLP